MRTLVVVLLALCLAVPAVAIADRGGDRQSAAASAVAKKKQKRAKKRHQGRKATRPASERTRLQRSSVRDEREVTGTLTSLSPVTVGALTCAVPAGLPLTGIRVGDRVEITCDLVGGTWMLRKIHLEDRDGEEALDDEREVDGLLASLDPLTVGTLTCVRPAGVPLVGFTVGDRVELTCDLVADQWVARKLEHEDDDDHGDDDDRSGHGGDDDDDDHDSSGPGGGGDDDHDD